MRAFATDRAPASAANAPASELLAGPVECVTFHNAENGFCVLRVKARGHRDLVTVVGHAASVSAGEWLTATGNWVNDRQYGPQFKARFLRTSAPTTAEGIERYLASGMIRGIGPVYAKKLVAAFREAVFDVNRTRFLGHSVELRGHGHGRELVLAASCVWAEVAVFLDQPLGVVAGDEGSDGVAEVFEGLEDAAVDDLLLECAEEPLDDAVGLGLAYEGEARSHAQARVWFWKSSAMKQLP